MLAPTLLVGLGGAGSKIVCQVSKLVTKEQREHIGFVVFDTDINELREIQRANPFIKIIQTSTKLTVGEYLKIDTHARDSWFPVNAILNNKSLTEGAGQVRAISRLAFDTALRAGRMEPLHEAIQELYKVQDDEEEQALRVIIVSSLAGGTGSGLILPAAMYIKHYLATHFRQGANITRGFFILPEVFDEVIPGAAERNNLRSNAYATLRELDAFLMKSDATLPEEYKDSVRMEFPRVGSHGYEEYNDHIYDFCFLFDAQNADGGKLNSYKQYISHAANCIYAQSIGPMNERSNSSEDNTIRRLCEEHGRNRYAGAGSSLLIYPFEDIKEYIGLDWTKQGVSKQWMVFDNIYNGKIEENKKKRAQGLSTSDPDPALEYVNTVETMAKNSDAFAKAIINSCSVFSADGFSKVSDKWTEYVDQLEKKISDEQSFGQDNLDGQREQTAGLIQDLGGGKDSWDDFIGAYSELLKYKNMAAKNGEETAQIIAYAMFRAPLENAAGDKSGYRLETYMLDENRQFIHPNAVRYFLYKALRLLKEEKRVVANKLRDETSLFDNFSKAHFDDARTDETETVESLSDRKVPLVNLLTKKMDANQQTLKDAYNSYLVNVDEYRVNLVLDKVMEEGIAYVDGLCKAFQAFYKSLGGCFGSVDDRMSAIRKKYEHTKGTTARYVCASAQCLKKLTEVCPYMGGTVSIDTKLAEGIYNKVRKYSMLQDAPKNDSFFSELFESIVDYFESSLMQISGAKIDVDIISAIEAEAMYERDEYDESKLDQYVRKVIRSTRALSCPFIEKPLGEERDPIYACAYNPELEPKDESPRTQLIRKELGNSGGVADEDISKYMILFYQSFYGLRANDLSKFAPPEVTLTSNRSGGEYYKAYFELIDMLHPEASRSKAITPHIDRWWHVVTKMPDLDEKNQEMQEQRIYSAFFWGLAGTYIDLFDLGADKKAYRLKVDDLDISDDANVLIVSNGTPCDHLYEVLDSFAIYPELVDKLLQRVNYLTDVDVEKGVSADSNMLMTCLNSFRLKEFPLNDEMRARSVFDIPILMKKSIKTEYYNEENVLQILKAEISEIKRYFTRICSSKELAEVMGNVLRTQFDMFLLDIAEENVRGKSIYNDFLFSRSCTIIAKAFEELGLLGDYEATKARCNQLSK